MKLIRLGDTRVVTKVLAPRFGLKYLDEAAIHSRIFEDLPAIGAISPALGGKPEQFVTAVTEKLLTYALGRQIESYDAPAVRKIVRGSAPDYRWSSVILNIVKSTPFQMRRSRQS